MSKRETLPPLAALQAFEASARLGNFTAAARELQSTQSAISQHIRRLEHDLGVMLFFRRYRGVGLTEDGRKLLEFVSQGLATLTEGIELVKQQKSRAIINVGTDFALASYWLLPLLSRFREAHPEVEVRVVTSQNPMMPDDTEIDFAILFGNGKFGRAPSRLLLREAVVPVCSPKLLQQRAAIQQIDELNQLPLLELEAEHDAQWFDWKSIFAAMSAEQPPRHADLLFNNYTLLMQAAIAGQGVAIGWHPMCDTMLESGLLVALLEKPIYSDCGYYLVLPANKAVTPVAQQFCDWLIQEGRSELATMR